MPQAFDTYLIDPHKRSITPARFTGDYGCIYKLIDADCYDAARINKFGDALFVDDEGLFKEDQAFFLHEDYPQPLAGKAVVLGCRASDGETIAPTTTFEELVSKIKFVTPISVNGVVMWFDHMGQPVEVDA